MTDEELNRKLLLEFCGFKRCSCGYCGSWIGDDGVIGDIDNEPILDSNFYLKYAVPKLKELGLKFTLRFSETFLIRFYKERYDCVAVAEHEDLTEAFGQALLFLIKEGK